MIPIKLLMKNFMCYKGNVPELSFEGIHIACLCGDNGHGKSAIFDAMTWALWGKSRAKIDEDLIHIGTNEMQVELEFIIKNQKYRVIRKLSRKTRNQRHGQLSLELQVYYDNQFKPITGNKIFETQMKINELLRLDYDTFVNSAFLRQGHADEFSIKRPSDRKEVLSNILGLSKFDDMAEKTKEIVIQKENEREAKEKFVQEYSSEIPKKHDYIQELIKIEEKLKNIAASKKEKEDNINILRIKNEDLNKLKEQYSSATIRINELEQELNNWQKKTIDIKKKIAEYEQLTNERETIECNYTKLVSLKDKEKEFNSKLNQLIKLREMQEVLEKTIMNAENQIKLEYIKLQESIKLKEKRCSQQADLVKELEEIKANLRRIDSLEVELNEKRELIKQLRSQAGYEESAINGLIKEIGELNDKLKILSSGESRCPLCDSELGFDRLQKLQDEFKGRINEKTVLLNAKRLNIVDIKKQLAVLEREVVMSESSIAKEKISWHNKSVIIEKDLIECKNSEKELITERKKLEDIDSILRQKLYAENEQRELNNLIFKHKQLGYDSQEHEQIRRDIERLMEFEKLKSQLDNAVNILNNQRSALNEATDIINELENSMQNKIDHVKKLEGEITKLSNVTAELQEAEHEYQIILNQEKDVTSQAAVLKEKIADVEKIENKIKQYNDIIQELKFEENIYKELYDAFGKKGVQALLIKQAFPEIEIEANRLLNKITDNRLSLTLESQRELKSRRGEVIETLDIKISDELGTRNYEMYSGGEAFRIDLALRIALSKLLVRRAGASLPILIIDEGFGTQDSSGRERLVEAIKSIEDDFEKIFVITHLEELKDYFPVIINVSKTSEGSVISVT